MTFLQDVRFAFRILGKRPWLTLMIVMVLAAGIGVNTTVFTLFNAVLVRGLPFPDGDRLLFVDSNDLPNDRDDLATSYPDFLDRKAGTTAFTDLAGYSGGEFNLSDDAAAAERREGSRITANLFSLLQVQPVVGRDFLPEEDQPGAKPVVLLSHGLWQERYGGSDDVIGQQLRVDEHPHTIVGVMPRGLRFPTDSELWMPLVAEGDWLDRDARRMGVVGRLVDGATRDTAQAELEVVSERLQREYPETNKTIGVNVLTANENFNGGNIETLFLAMLGAVGFVLLIACANVANVQLTRAADREREMSIRTALGAGRWRIVRQLLIESVMLAVAGGLVGLVFAYIGVRLFDDATFPFRPYFIDFRFDGVVFAYLGGMCVAVGLLFGMAPAVHALRTNVNESLKEGSRGQTGGTGAAKFRTAMVIGEVALSVVLLVGAGLFMRSFWTMYTLDLGVETDSRLIGRVVLPELKYGEQDQQRTFRDAALAKVRALPGVRGATVTSHLPGRGGNGRAVEIEGQPVEDLEQAPSEAMLRIETGYFDVWGTPVLEGREFTAADAADALDVAIVNRAFADTYWPGETAVGKRLKLGAEPDRPWITVVGVGPNIRQNGASVPEVRPAIYRPQAQSSSRGMFFVADTAVPPATLARSVRQAIAQVDPDLPVLGLMAFEERLSEDLWGVRVFGTVFAVFAAVALVLAAVGVFALVADSVRRRVPEFGIRLALGAAPRQIFRLVMSGALRRVGLGVVLGLPMAYGAAQVIQSVLVGVDASDLLTLGGVAGFLLAVAVVACWLPARRVTQIDPGSALRQE